MFAWTSARLGHDGARSRTCLRLRGDHGAANGGPAGERRHREAGQGGVRTARKPRCEDCFFHQNMLCALEDKKPCPTFRPAHPDGLRPPRQLSFVFRQGRRPDLFAFDASSAQG